MLDIFLLLVLAACVFDAMHRLARQINAQQVRPLTLFAAIGAGSALPPFLAHLLKTVRGQP